MADEKTDFTEDDEKFMKLAVAEAQKAWDNGEVPIGCVIVMDGEVIGRGRNRKAELKIATAHAEMMAIDEASKFVGDWRLEKCTMYVTLEPCLMCAGTIVHTRMKEVVYGVPEPKFGGVESLAKTFDIEGMNHKVKYRSGIFQEEIAGLLKGFFKELREKRKARKLLQST